MRSGFLDTCFLFFMKAQTEVCREFVTKMFSAFDAKYIQQLRRNPGNWRGRPVDVMPSYFDENLYLRDFLPFNANEMRDKVVNRLNKFGAQDERVFVLRARNFKIEDAFDDLVGVDCLADRFGVVVADTFVVCAPARFEGLKLFLQFVALHLCW